MSAVESNIGGSSGWTLLSVTFLDPEFLGGFCILGKLVHPSSEENNDDPQ
jgi:hypothetical protein